MNKEKVLAGFTQVLEGLGVDLQSPHFINSPQRIAHAWTEELCAGLNEPRFHLTTFPLEPGDEPGMVVLQHIPVKSLCAHHLLPFIGEATVAYIPSELLCGLSKLSRVVNHFARKPQVQEHLTSEIARYLNQTLKPQGVGVIIKASHLCMEMRGVGHPGLMTTSSLTGSFMQDEVIRNEFMALAHARGDTFSRC